MEPDDLPSQPERRGFFKGICALVLGAAAGLVPFVAGLGVLFDPLRRKSQGGEAILVASLNALPDDGTPRKFSVVTDHTDGWNKFPHVPVGAVYLRRMGEKKVQAFNVVCPHAGCFVDYEPARKGYHCPCHKSTFALNGERGAKSPSPRGLDELEVDIRNETEIWIKFRNFQAGTAEKIPIA